MIIAVSALVCTSFSADSLFIKSFITNTDIWHFNWKKLKSLKIFVLNSYVKITNNFSSWYLMLIFHAGMLYLWNFIHECILIAKFLTLPNKTV